MYYKVLLQYYSKPTPTLLCTTKYYSSTTKCYSKTTPYYKVLLCTTKYYSSTTPVLKYHSVLQSTTPVLKYHSVPQSTTPILLCTTKYYSSTTPVLLWLPSTAPVLLRTTKYYASTTPVLQSPNWVLVCTTKRYSSTPLYYSSSTLYYKVLLQYYSVLQSTTPVLQSTTPVLQSTTPVLLCTTKYYSGTTLYYIVLLRYYFETSFTMRGATGITLQPHQILRLPRKMNVMIDSHHTWNVIYNAGSNKHHPPTSPNTAPATQNECHDWATSQMKRHLQCAEQQASPSNLTKYCACLAKWMSWLIRITYETSFTMRGATSINLQPHQILRLPRKMTTQDQTESSWKQLKRHFQCATDPRMIREWSETDPTQKTQNWTRRAAKATFRTRQEQILLKITTFPAPAIIRKFTTCCACHEKWHMNFTKCCACHEKWHEKWPEVTHDYYYYYYYYYY